MDALLAASSVSRDRGKGVTLILGRVYSRFWLKELNRCISLNSLIGPHLRFVINLSPLLFLIHSRQILSDIKQCRVPSSKTGSSAFSCRIPPRRTLPVRWDRRWTGFRRYRCGLKRIVSLVSWLFSEYMEPQDGH